MSALRFSATIDIRGINPFVRVTADQAARLKKGWRKPLPVRLRVNGKPDAPWRTNLMPVGDGGFTLYLPGAVRKASKTQVGDAVVVELEFDEAYRGGPAAPPPPWFANALGANAAAAKAWEDLIPSRRKEILRYLANLKSDGAKARHVARAVEVLSGRPGRFMARSWNEDPRSETADDGADYEQVLDFWFKELAPRQWFAGGVKLDEAVRARFGGLVEAAREGALDGWAANPRGRLALILVLDQFSRHVHRSGPLAFAGDARAQALAVEGIGEGADETLADEERRFLYMPLMHAEDAELQALSVEKFATTGDTSALSFARRHRATIERFGRFPHRNAAIGRPSTAEEEAFLASRKRRRRDQSL
ncbi:MAG TPA: DUF924 family protein [Caulobacteraceae bacterium]